MLPGISAAAPKGKALRRLCRDSPPTPAEEPLPEPEQQPPSSAPLGGCRAPASAPRGSAAAGGRDGAPARPSLPPGVAAPCRADSHGPAPATPRSSPPTPAQAGGLRPGFHGGRAPGPQLGQSPRLAAPVRAGVPPNASQFPSLGPDLLRKAKHSGSPCLKSHLCPPCMLHPSFC